MAAPPKSRSSEARARRLIAENRKARHEYDLLEVFEAGLVLRGSEVKSLRGGKGNIGEAWVRLERGEAYLVDAHIPPYAQAGPYNNHEPTRERKLLLKDEELRRLEKRVQEKGLTIVPVALVFQGPWVKVEIALGRGRKLHDKRAAIKAREGEREARREMGRE